ncbi:signal peptide peptidase [Dictyocaulus viviparus]|uniref:Signal peptide peptidase n=1 Tax=Dictyocaulus viviparus TaxID=29172 RepID=A0A0D8Y016_DICVI|nr:signal peptide peptidase [Dictyocaulus viviparus]
MASCSLYAMSLLCIIIGSIRSSNFVKRQITKKRLIEASISLSEAKKFPFMASIVLFSLYIFFKPNCREWLMVLGGTYLPQTYSAILNNTLMKTDGPGLFARLSQNVPESVLPYFDYIPSVTKDHVTKFLLILISCEGCVALAALLKPIFSYFLFLLPIGNRCPRLNLPYFLSLRKGMKEMEEGDIIEANKKDYAGSLLLAGLFIYDIFWVFATDVMVSVAKGIDAPILLQFPQDLLRNGWLNASKNSMLGLGDIVIPGIFIALLRRFDLRLGGNNVRSHGKRSFFIVTVIAYTVGLLISMLVMHHFKAAQPALLYLVPCCLLTPLLLASFSGETKELWNYNEEHLTDKSEKEKDKNSKKTN